MVFVFVRLLMMLAMALLICHYGKKWVAKISLSESIEERKEEADSIEVKVKGISNIKLPKVKKVRVAKKKLTELKKLREITDE